MAQLHIQEKNSATWVWWVIGIIVLALLAWWLFAGNRDDTVVEQPAAVTPVAPATTTDDRVTDLSVLTSTTALSAANRSVALSSVPVTNVVSDKGFWIGGTDAVNQGVFVVRGNQDASYTAPDGAVMAGQQVAVYGVVQQMPSDLSQQAVDWNLNSTDQTLLASQAIYILADSVRIQSR